MIDAQQCAVIAQNDCATIEISVNASKGAESLFFVRELGFANVAMGGGIASLFAASVLAICCFA